MKTKSDDNKTLSELVMEYKSKKNKHNTEIAQKIADLYLEKFPRELSYAVNFSSTEDDRKMTYYFIFSEEEKRIINMCSKIAEEEECPMDEVLSSEDDSKDLYDRLCSDVYLNPFKLDVIDSIDLDDAQKFTKFSFQSINEDGTLRYEKCIGKALTDDEFKEILVELLLNRNNYSMNMLVYHKPELCQKIIEHMTYASVDFVYENWKPYIADMSEHKDICEKILNPFKDLLNIFNSEDKDIVKFAENHQITPDPFDNEIFVDKNDEDWFHCFMNFVGTKLCFRQEGITDKGRYHDLEMIKVDARKVMERFSLKTPEEIFPYLKEHYNTRDCLYRIKKDFEEQTD